MTDFQFEIKRCSCCHEEKIRAIHFSLTSQMCRECVRKKIKVNREVRGILTFDGEAFLWAKTGLLIVE